MNKLLLLALVLPLNAYAIAVTGVDTTCVLDDGSVIQNCVVIPGVNGEAPNVYMKFNHATTRVDDTALPIEEIASSNIYFQATGNMWTNQVIEGTHNAVFLYKKPETYSTIVTTTDIFGNESPSDNAIVVTVVDTPIDIPPPIDPPPVMSPQAPTVWFALPKGNTATIVIKPGAVQ